MLKDTLLQQIPEIARYISSANGIGAALLDGSLQIQECNLGFMRLFAPTTYPTGASLRDFINLPDSELLYEKELKLSFSHYSGRDGVCYCYFIKTDSGSLMLCEKAVLSESDALEQMGALNNELVNLQRTMVKKNHSLELLQRELHGRVEELQSALERIKRLEGLISICMYCKKVRNEQESWEHVEKYIADHTDAEFSHGICPSCLDEKYPVQAGIMNGKQ